MNRKLDMEVAMEATTKPIGYWLRHLHNLIEEQFGVTLTDFGVNRRQWQLMNLLSSGAQSRTEAAEELAPFWQDSEPRARLGDVLDGPAGLLTRGWVRLRPDTDLLGLTTEGRTRHAALAARVRDTREALMRGLTTDQYTETVRILAVMCTNLETALADRAAGTRREG